MRIATSIVVLTVVAMVTVDCGASHPESTLVITNVNIVDVHDGTIVEHSTVTIGGDTIASTTRTSGRTARARVVDGQGGYLMPGLWDMHAHGAAQPLWRQLYVLNGVTGIRDMGADLDEVDVIVHARAAIEAGALLGPRIVFAGPILDDAPEDFPARVRVRTAEDGREAVRLLKGRGVDFIKVHDRTPREAYFGIVEEAQRQQLPVVGHVPLALTVAEVIDAGQAGIEHLDNFALWRSCSGGQEYRAESCRPFFELLAARQIWQTPTLVAFAEFDTIGTPDSRIDPGQMPYAPRELKELWTGLQSLFGGPAVAQRRRAAAAVGATVTRDMDDAGVGILAGCDAMVPGFCVHDELDAMVRGGMSPVAALRTATLNPARHLGLEHALGSVQAGKQADLVLLDANPLIDIANTRRIRAVVRGGRLLDRAELDGLLEAIRVALIQE